MKRLLSILFIFLTFCSFSIRAEEKEIEFRESNQKDTFDDRSTIILPTVVYNGYSLAFYSNYAIEDMQIIIEDAMGNEVLNVVSTLPPQQVYELTIPSKEEEEYTLRIIIDKTEYYGYF